MPLNRRLPFWNQAFQRSCTKPFVVARLKWTLATRKSLMDFEDWLAYELCVPGGITGETDVDCPHCGVNLTVAVDDPGGNQAHAWCACSGMFAIDWADGTTRWPG
jgi:hypothetical protein